MNSLVLLVIGFAALAAGYAFYSRKVVDWLGVDESQRMPSEELHDGVDYVKARHWTILFGHHFASIAGAAPIIGPVLACYYWGWVPAVLWIVIGGIFFGAVHDYFSLVYSVSHRGRSISDLSASTLGNVARIAFGVFVFLALILVVAVFAAYAAATLVRAPEVVIPTFGLMFVAVAAGLMFYRTSVPAVLTTLIGLAMLFGLIVLGYHFPLSLPEKFQVPILGIDVTAAQSWTVILLLYGMIASVIPVTLLLQPRDHLSTGILFAGMLLGIIGVCISHRAVESPTVVSFGSAQGTMWPMLFVVVACGAISGFHSLVSSGTTSKQLPRMRDARPIGYGGMIMESALALLAVICVSAGLHWKEAPAGAEGFVYQTFMGAKDPIGAFGAGYGRITAPVVGVALGMLIGITMLNAFIMTTLDSATRITRYIAGELFGDTLRLRPMRNRFVATAVVGVPAGWLALSDYNRIWPIFGASNQLVGSMVLIIATVYLVSRRRFWGFAAIPAALILGTTIAALIWQMRGFLNPPAGKEPSYLLAGIASLLILLAALVVFRGLVSIVTAIRGGVPKHVAARSSGE